MAAPEPLPGRARERAQVHAAMVIEAPVLVGDEHGEIARIDIMRRRRQPPAPVRQSEGPQQAAVSVDDDGRYLARRREVDRPEARFVARPGEGRGDARGEDERDGGQREEERAVEAHGHPHPGPSPASGRGGAPLLPLGGEGGAKRRMRACSDAPHFAVTSTSPNAVRP